jgi:hypothetical protein
MPATRPDKLPPIDVGAWVRVGARFQGADPKKLDDQSMDSVYGELHAGGKIHKNVSVTLNLNANGLAGTAGIEDAIIGFDFADPFHLWVGQLLVPADRANGAGPFFMIPWNYPGFFTVGQTTVAALPAEGPSGRNAGGVVWGEFMEGTLKYFLGAFNAADATKTPLYSGRLNLALIGKEPGFWGNASYFGDKDVLALGLSGQFQRNGSVGDPPKNAAGMAIGPAPLSDYSEFSADLFGEFKVGDGWVTGEADYYHYSGDFNPIKNSFFVMAAFASPTVGIGHIQPMVRYQGAKEELPTETVDISAIDIGLAYLIKGPALRATATYQHVDLGHDVVGNSLQLGAQAIFF